MSFISEFDLLLKARYSLIYIPTYEEDRLEYTIRKCVKLGKNRAIYTWNFVDGFINTPNNMNSAKRNPIQALEFIERLSDDTPVIFLLKDFHKFFNDIAVLRKLRNLARLLQTQPKTIIIVAPEVISIPIEIQELITVLEFELPTINEIRSELKRLIDVLGHVWDDKEFELIVQACQGLSLDRIRRVLSKIITANGVIDSNGILSILEEKRQIINQTQILEFYSTDYCLDDIGGLENLKNWLRQRSSALSERAKNYGLPVPRGLLLVGIQGTGKSLTAQAIANDWKSPLLRLDFGRLFGGIVGESEARVREMIRITEALAPCILWIDEIDKAFQQSEFKGDSGTTSRVLATFLTWLSEKKSQVFIVATANNFQVLPLELIRKGRFDEIFFVGLPNEIDRRKIFKVLLSKLRPGQLSNFDFSTLSQSSAEFSGAEISQAITEGMFYAYNQDREFTTDDILLGLNNIIPLAKIERQKILELQEWAKSGRIRLASSTI